MHGTALAVDLHGDGVRLTKSVTPVTAAQRDQAQLGVDAGTTDGGGDFLADLVSETDVAVGVTDQSVGDETVALTWES